MGDFIHGSSQLFVSNMPLETSIGKMRQFFGAIPGPSYFYLLRRGHDSSKPLILSSYLSLCTGIIGMRLGRENARHHNRSGWILFKHSEQCDAAISILQGEYFAPHPSALWLQKGEEGKSAGWDWDMMSSVGDVSRQRRRRFGELITRYLRPFVMKPLKAREET